MAGPANDAPVVRALLVPALVALLGLGNWWIPRRARKSPHRTQLASGEDK